VCTLKNEKARNRCDCKALLVVRSTGLEPICLFFDGVNRFRNRVKSRLWGLCFMQMQKSFLPF
jgi:hypothetical protein